MKKVTVQKQQNIIDLAIQEYGSIEGLIQLAKDNDLSLDEDMVAGAMLEVNESKINNQPLVDYFKQRDIIIATGVSDFIGVNTGGIFDFTFDFTFE